VSIKAKPISGGFNKAVRGQPRPAMPAQNQTDIKTKAELEHRKARRAKPAPALAPPMPARHRLNQLKTQAANKNEHRIAELKAGLDKMSGKAKTHHRLAVLKGDAVRSFDKAKVKGKERTR